jgi:excisionase family DNA binding protein
MAKASPKNPKKPAGKKAKPKTPPPPKPKTPSEPKPEAKPAPSPQPAPQEVPLISLEEVAQMLHMAPLQVRIMVQAGRIPGVKVDGQWRFNRDLVYEAFHRRSRGM